ncbi:carbon storage regulator CsrA [Thermodesulfitimonas sp.]
MLVLTRRRGKTVVIGHNIEVMVVDIREEQVRLGIKAPKEVPVYRKEIFELIEAENLRAASSLPPPEVLKGLAGKCPR